MLKSVLLIGQSNMAGRGNFGEVEEIYDERIFSFRNGKWQVMWEPVNPDRSFAGVGLSPSFALDFVNYYNEPIGLIPCADGGTGIAEWVPGTTLFENAVMQAKFAMKSSEIVAILWHQGENDSKRAERAEHYEKNFMSMITELKKELGLEKIPVIIGELGAYLADYENNMFAYLDSVNGQLKHIAETNENFAFVSSKGLTCKDDGVHFDSKSLRIFGKRYFEAYKNVAENLK